MNLQYKFTVALLIAAWMTAGICAQYTSTVSASGNAPQSGINEVVHAKKHGKRAKNARTRKGAPVTSDGDAEVFAQVLGSDNKNPLWGKPQQ